MIARKSDKRYDAIQRNIRINHIAHVEKGRAGESVRIELDSDMDFAVMQDREIEAGGKMGNQEKTKTFRTDDGRDIQVPEALHPEFMKQKEIIETWCTSSFGSAVSSPFYKSTNRGPALLHGRK